ncbi:MAG: LysR family transcriptional regulator [Emcibacter sp.]|nr:LysR family transcriptional regulator [Emcibacter sp.]
MGTLLNIKAFLLVARKGSFSSAARDLGVAPSVMTKRVTRLEDQMGAKLFHRSTRGLSLTTEGEDSLPHYLRLTTELDEIIKGDGTKNNGLKGHVRIMAPITITSIYLGGVFSQFQALHKDVTLEIMLMNRSVNPLEDGYDMVVAANPASYPNVVDVPLCSYPQVLCCSPEYLKNVKIPEHPRELINYDCLNSALFGMVWRFESPRGEISIEVRSRTKTNDASVVLKAAREGLGIGVLPFYLAEIDLQKGRLVQLLEDFPVVDLWIKVLVPRVTLQKPIINMLISYLKTRMMTIPSVEV